MGTSAENHRSNDTARDHPHAYGDKMFIKNTMEINLGSSPRVWGQVAHQRVYVLCRGIIPTRMGTSFINPVIEVTSQDHPHAYGDKTKEIKENSGFAKSTA